MSAIETKITPSPWDDGMWRVLHRLSGSSQWWNVGIDFPSVSAAQTIADAIERATSAEQIDAYRYTAPCVDCGNPFTVSRLAHELMLSNEHEHVCDDCAETRLRREEAAARQFTPSQPISTR